MKLTTCNICGCLKNCIINFEEEEAHEMDICLECLGISPEVGIKLNQQDDK